MNDYPFVPGPGVTPPTRAFPPRSGLYPPPFHPDHQPVQRLSQSSQATPKSVPSYFQPPKNSSVDPTPPHRGTRRNRKRGANAELWRDCAILLLYSLRNKLTLYRAGDVVAFCDKKAQLSGENVASWREGKELTLDLSDENLAALCSTFDRNYMNELMGAAGREDDHRERESSVSSLAGGVVRPDEATDGAAAPGRQRASAEKDASSSKVSTSSSKSKPRKKDSKADADEISDVDLKDGSDSEDNSDQDSSTEDALLERMTSRDVICSSLRTFFACHVEDDTIAEVLARFDDNTRGPLTLDEPIKLGKLTKPSSFGEWESIEVKPRADVTRQSVHPTPQRSNLQHKASFHPLSAHPGYDEIIKSRTTGPSAPMEAFMGGPSRRENSAEQSHKLPWSQDVPRVSGRPEAVPTSTPWEALMKHEYSSGDWQALQQQHQQQQQQWAAYYRQYQPPPFPPYTPFPPNYPSGWPADRYGFGKSEMYRTNGLEGPPMPQGPVSSLTGAPRKRSHGQDDAMSRMQDFPPSSMMKRQRIP